MSAIISDCGRYRYRLERELRPNSIPPVTAGIIMVNPSTADATEDDATIRKLKGFGERNGWSRFIVGNLFAYRATDVRELAEAYDPRGPENVRHLVRIVADADVLVFAWGSSAKLPRRLRAQWRTAWEIAEFAEVEPLSIGPPAKDGHPCHPLMLSYSLPLIPWHPGAL